MTDQDSSTTTTATATSSLPATTASWGARSFAETGAAHKQSPMNLPEQQQQQEQSDRQQRASNQLSWGLHKPSMSHPGYTFGDPNHHQPQHHHRQDQYHAAQIPHGHAPHRQSLQQAHAAESDVTEIKDASDFPTLTTQFFTGYMEQPWNQTSHVVKGSGDAGISEEGTKSFTSESRTSAGESVSSSHGTPSSFSSSDKVLDHNAQATRSFDTVTVPLQEHPLSIPTALLRGTCAPAATAAASLEPIMTYSEAARRGNIDTNNGAGLRAAVFASKNELKGGGPSSASLPPFSSGRANPTTQLTRPESGNPERVASMGQRTHHSQVTLPTPSKKTDLAPQLVVSLTDVKSPQAQLAREDSSHFSQLNPFKTEPGNHHHGSSMDVAPLQSQKAPTIQSADRDKGLSTTQSMSFNKPNLVSQSVTSQTDEETASSVLALKRPILEQTQPQPPPLSLGYVQATGTSSLRPSCNIDIPTSQPLSSFKMDTVVKSPMSQKEPVLRLRALHAAEERDYRTQAMKTISDSDVSLVTTASTTDPISTKREHHQLSGNISSDRKNSGPRASFPYPSMPVMSDKTLEEGFKMTSPGSNGVSSDDVNSVDRTNSSLELTETGQIHLTDFEVYAKVFAISALKAIEDFLSVIFDTLTRMFTIITMPPAKDKDPGYDDTYDKDIRLSIPEKKASFLEGIPHGPWKRTFKGGEFPNNLTLSSTISPYAASAMYSDVNLRDLPVAPWCGTTLIGNPSGWYKQRGQARIDDVRHQEIQSMSPVDQWHRTRRIPRLCKVMNGSGPRGSGPYVTPPIREKAAMARLTNYPMRLQGEGGLWSPEIRPEYRKPHPGSTFSFWKTTSGSSASGKKMSSTSEKNHCPKRGQCQKDKGASSLSRSVEGGSKPASSIKTSTSSPFPPPTKFGSTLATESVALQTLIQERLGSDHESLLFSTIEELDQRVAACMNRARGSRESLNDQNSAMDARL